MPLAEYDLETSPPPRPWLPRALVALGVMGLVVGLALEAKSLLGGAPSAKRQVSTIAILPDTPPPPPPPPKEERKPEPPKDDPKQVVREEQLKPDTPKPANEPIKMDGPAGDGPSAFAAGSISKEYQGGAPTVGAPGGTGNATDRAQERFYANAVRQLLRDAIEKHLRQQGGELTATFSIWVEADGSIRRFELLPSGDSARDGDLRAALDQTSRELRLPSPNSLPQPMRFRLSLRGA